MIRNLASIINGASDKSLINDFKSALKLCRCPRCNSYKVVRNGTYKRKTSYIKEDSTIITIQKYKCNKCLLSFKELPRYLSSNNHLSLVSLLKVLISDDSINKTSRLLELSRSTIKRIRIKYETIKRKILTLIRKVSIDSIDNLIDYYYKEFHEYLFEPSTTLDTYINYIVKIP